MKKYILYSLLALAFFSSCKKEAALQPSNIGKNYFANVDNPSDSVDHAIYLFYKATGIPVFYKDTIGSELRTDPFGLSYTYYTKLGIDYNPDQTTISTGPAIRSTYYVNLKKKANVIAALKFVTNNILPLPAGISVASIFCPDTLNSVVYGTNAFKGFNTVVMGAVPRIGTLSAKNTITYKAAMLRAIAGPYILDSKNTAYLNANYYSISRAFLTTGVDIFGLSAFNIQLLNGIPYSVYSLVNPTTYLLSIGFIKPDPTQIYSVTSPPTWMDVNFFIEAIFTYNTAQFTALYGSYPAIMKKYVVMKGMLKDLGFTVS